MPHTPPCPYCGQPTVLTDSAVVYGGRSFGNIWDCRPCDAYVGIHRGSNAPLGTPANAELRQLRKEAHQAFDPLWQSGTKTRTEAYAWMAVVMGLPPEKAHIGMFDLDQCRRLISLSNPKTRIWHHGKELAR